MHHSCWPVAWWDLLGGIVIRSPKFCLAWSQVRSPNMWAKNLDKYMLIDLKLQVDWCWQCKRVHHPTFYQNLVASASKCQWFSLAQAFLATFLRQALENWTKTTERSLQYLISSDNPGMLSAWGVFSFLTSHPKHQRITRDYKGSSLALWPNCSSDHRPSASRTHLYTGRAQQFKGSLRESKWLASRWINIGCFQMFPSGND